MTREEVVRKSPCLNCLVVSVCIQLDETGVIYKPCPEYYQWGKQVRDKEGFEGDQELYKVFRKLLGENKK